MEDYKCNICDEVIDSRVKDNSELIKAAAIIGGVFLLACIFIFKRR